MAFFASIRARIASEITTFHIPSGATSLGCMNGYAEDYNVFSFCPAYESIRENGQMLPGKFMWQDHRIDT
jgi:hypothetical protein